MRVAAVSSIAAFAVLAIILLINQPKPTQDSLPLQRPTQSREITPTVAIPQPTIEPLPFREQQSFTIRILDRVTGSPVAGAVAYSDADASQVCSRGPTDNSGFATLVLSGDVIPFSQIYIRVPQLQPGRIIPVDVSEPIGDIVIPLYSRIRVETDSPIILDQAESYSDVGYLWCASWPPVQDVLPGQADDKEKNNIDAMYILRRLESHRKVNDDRAVEYHANLKRYDGCDISKIICMREEVRPGTSHDFDIAFSGDVIVSYYLPGLEAAQASAKAIPGEVSKVIFNAIESKMVRIVIENDQGEGVPDARVVVVTRRDIDPNAPCPTPLTVLFSPEGSSRRIAIRRHYLESNDQGEVDIRLIGADPGELYVSATKPGYIGAGVDLWSGFGLPPQSVFSVVLKRGNSDMALLTVDGRPLPNCDKIVVTDLEPTSILGQIEYPYFYSDLDGMVCFEQLIVGHRYGIIAQTDEAAYGAIITWYPGATIALEVR